MIKICLVFSLFSILTCFRLLNLDYYHFQFEEIFNPYSRYCSEQTNCQEYCKEQDRNSEVFKAYLAVSWLENPFSRRKVYLVHTYIKKGVSQTDTCLFAIQIHLFYLTFIYLFKLFSYIQNNNFNFTTEQHWNHIFFSKIKNK